MDRKTIVLVTAFLFLVCGVPSAYAVSFKDLLGGGRCEELLGEKEKKYEDLLVQEKKNNQALVVAKQTLDARLEELQKQNTQLIDTCQNVDSDRENLMLQSERLRRENSELMAAKEAYDRLTVQNESLITARTALDEHIKQLQSDLDAVKVEKAQVLHAREELTQQLQEALDKQKPFLRRVEDKYASRIKTLDEQLDVSKKENVTLTNELKQTRKGVEVLEREKFRWEQQANVTQSKFEELERQFEKIQRENVVLTDETRTFPRRFTDLANQNQRLIKETSDMHYNLGVFYVKNKQYKRAVSEFEKVLDLKPEDPQTHYNLGYIYAEHLVDRHKAIKYFEGYLVHAPDAQDADWVRKYLLTWETWYGKAIIK